MSQREFEMPITDDAPPAIVEVPEADLRRVVAEHRARGLEPWRMDVHRHGYTLYFRRSVAVEGGYD